MNHWEIQDLKQELAIVKQHKQELELNSGATEKQLQIMQEWEIQLNEQYQFTVQTYEVQA